MKVEAIVPTKQVIDILCDVCGSSTKYTLGSIECECEYGTLEASWGYGSRHDLDRYQVHLCEDCFFETLAYLRQEHRIKNVNSEDYQPADPDTFGLVEGNKEIL